MNSLLITDLGLISYADASALQDRLVAARKAGVLSDVFLLCEHPHVITLGRNGNRANLLASEHVLRQKGVELHASNRGGDITYHGPGQIVGYPILNLNHIKRDVGWYVRTLEEAMIRASADFGITAYRVPGKTGIWVKVKGLEGASPRSSQTAVSLGGRSFSSPRAARGSDINNLKSTRPVDLGLSPGREAPLRNPISGSGAEEKLGAIGVHLSRWVTSHGFAYNVSTDLRYFDLIVPCGIADRKATSLEKLLSRDISPDEVKPRLVHHLADLLSLRPQELSRDHLLRTLDQIHAVAP